MNVCLNADVGESFGPVRVGNDEALIPLISAASIACGMHAGDPTMMIRTIDIALQHGVAIGAHPGFNDIWGFGRRPITMKPQDIEYLVTYQIGALQALAATRQMKVGHVKPHGALNNMAHRNADVARAVARGIKAADRDLVFFANCCSEMTKAGEAEGLQVAHEAYVDRPYDADGAMVSRFNDNAVITDPRVAAEHVLRMVSEQALFARDGTRIPTPIDTLCIHGDEPTAVKLAEATRQALAVNGFRSVPIGEMRLAAPRADSLASPEQPLDVG
jgi:UPF0271 protein